MWEEILSHFLYPLLVSIIYAHTRYRYIQNIYIGLVGSDRDTAIPWLILTTPRELPKKKKLGNLIPYKHVNLN